MAENVLGVLLSWSYHELQTYYYILGTCWCSRFITSDGLFGGRNWLWLVEMLELDPVRLQDAFEGNIYSFISWQLNVSFVWDLLFKILLIFQFGVFGCERCKCGFLTLTQNMLLTSAALKSQLACPNPPRCGRKADSTTVLPRLQSKSKRTFKPWRPIIQPHYAFLLYHFLSCFILFTS